MSGFLSGYFLFYILFHRIPQGLCPCPLIRVTIKSVKKHLHFKLYSAIAAAIVVILFCVGLWRLHSKNVAYRNTITSLEQNLGSTTLALSETERKNAELTEALVNEQEKVDDIERQFRKITNTVGTLQKLSKTEPELLQKYSKVYFLNEHYSPAKLTTIDQKYLASGEKDSKVDSRVWPYLKNMLEAALDENITINVASAYRAFGTQAVLKAGYSVTYGAGTANQFSADQGYSEHQLGTALDFSTATSTALTISFEKTEAFKWLKENAYKYGFVLSYPPTNSFYQYEPWHWRFVGKDLARRLHKENHYFYDLDQREINTYLAEIFD
jgi:LAS superfamily LD-carboxypeptidase LdcB